MRGYETEKCSGSYLEAGSYSELKEWHNQTDSFGNTWHFESFLYVRDEDKCHDFDMATIVVKGTRLPDDSYDVDDTNGDAGRGGSSGGPPIDYLDGNPGENFDEAKNNKLLRCWVKKALKLDQVKNWLGEHTDATWKGKWEERGENWIVTETDDLEKFGFTAYTKPENATSQSKVWINVLIYAKNIGNLAKNKTLPFDHLVMYWQMHEFVHVLQAVHERDDGDDQFVPYKSGSFIRELEALQTIDDWWLAIFGVNAPYNTPTTEKPENYDQDKARYNELKQKELDGTTLSKKEKEELAKLEEHFDKLPVPEAKLNTEYDKKMDPECDE